MISINDLKTRLIDFMASEYLNDNWEVVTGQNKFNDGLDPKEQIPVFSIGNFKHIPADFILVQMQDMTGDRSRFGNIGIQALGYNISLLLELEKSANAVNAAFLSDMYSERLVNLCQEFLYLPETVYIRPSLAVSKSYNDTGILNYNQIDKIKIAVTLNFDYQTGTAEGI